MSDYAISIKVRNGRIRRRIAECGFGSVSELCRKSGLASGTDRCAAQFEGFHR